MPSSLSQTLEEVETEYVKANPVSLQLHIELQNYLPGGNTRSVLHAKPFPISIVSGTGTRVTDADGHHYVDFVGEMTAGVYGHSHPVIVEAVRHVADEIGLSLGGTTPYEQELAKELCKRFKSIEKIRFCNSGTESNIQCFVVAKYFTGKTKFISMKGGYHGGPLGFFSETVSIYNINHEDFILCEYNNIEEFNQIFDANVDNLAGVVTEGMLGSGGCILGDVNFLKLIQLKCKQNNVVFILDEVMTSRLSYGGLQEKLGLEPDLTSLGKYIGGGFSAGAFGGRLDIMDLFNPLNSTHLPHSGTFNNNTMTMYVGLQGLQRIYTRQVATELNQIGDLLRQRLAKLMHGTKMNVTGCGSTMLIHFTNNGQGTSFGVLLNALVDKTLIQLKDLFWLDMVSLGYWVSNRGMINLNVVMNEHDLDKFVETVANWIENRYEYIRI